MKIIEVVRTLICYFLIGLACLLFMPICLVIACLPARYRYDNRLFFFLTDYFYKAVVYATLNKVIISGKENLPTEPAIFVANHQSAFDIPLLGSLCNGYPHVWLAMSYYLDSPVLGFFLKRMFVSVDQSNPGKAARSLIQVYKFVQGKKRHLLIFPEGGRYPDGLHKFYQGFGIIAQKTQRPVIPVYMSNNGKIYPPHSFLIHSYPVVAHIGMPFIMQPSETVEGFVQRIRDWFIEQAEKKA